MTTAEIFIPRHLSFSALSSYAECGERYRLERKHLNRGTWFATVAGSVIHTMTELHEKGETVKASDFEELFKSAIEAEIAKGIELKASGRVNKAVSFSGGPNKRDHSWWSEFGPQIFEAFVRWREEHAELEVLADTDGSLIGIEMELNIELGGVPIKAYVDRVFVNNETGQLHVVDYKSGNAPKSNLQLDTYAAGLEQTLGILPDWGGYLYPFWSKANDRVEVNIPEWHYTGSVSQEYLDYLYGQARKGIEADIFLPSPSSLCAGCGVRDYCRAQEGVFAQEVPIHSTIRVRNNEPEVRSPEEEEEVQ